MSCSLVYRKNYLRGFSLIETMLIMTILSLFIFTTYSSSNSRKNHEQYITTLNRLEFLRKSLINYYKLHNFLPCPAGLNENLGDIYYLNKSHHIKRKSQDENCNSFSIFQDVEQKFYRGAIAWQVLNIPYEYSLDGFGNKIIYTMAKKVNSDSLLLVKDINEQIISDETIFTLVSTGRSGKGGYNQNGDKIANFSKLSKEYYNLPIANFSKVQYGPSKVKNKYYQYYSLKTYDDILSYYSLSETM